MNGILCMNKPQQFTSFDVIGKLRGILHMKRLGHTGTLDPMATGVLPVLVGTATKACDILPNQDKTYRAAVQFGRATDTLDIWGTLTQQYPDMHITEEQLRTVLPDFVGEITQLPPMYSAVSVNGKRLYELARKGETVERPSRMVTVYDITLEAFDEVQQTAVLTVACGKGTYIRTLLSDIGQRLGGDAVMTALTRTAACGYSLAQCLTFEQVAAAVVDGTIVDKLLPTDSLFFCLSETVFECGTGTNVLQWCQAGSDKTAPDTGRAGLLYCLWIAKRLSRYCICRQRKTGTANRETILTSLFHVKQNHSENPNEKRLYYDAANIRRNSADCCCTGHYLTVCISDIGQF